MRKIELLENYDIILLRCGAEEKVKKTTFPMVHHDLNPQEDGEAVSDNLCNFPELSLNIQTH